MVRLLEEPSEGFSGPNYCKNRVLIDYREFALGAMMTNDSGPKQLELFTTRYDDEKDSARYQEASAFFKHIRSNVAMLKQHHGLKPCYAIGCGRAPSPNSAAPSRFRPELERQFLAQSSQEKAFPLDA